MVYGLLTLVSTVMIARCWPVRRASPASFPRVPRREGEARTRFILYCTLYPTVLDDYEVLTTCVLTRDLCASRPDGSRPGQREPGTPSRWRDSDGRSAERIQMRATPADAARFRPRELAWGGRPGAAVTVAARSRVELSGGASVDLLLRRRCGLAEDLPLSRSRADCAAGAPAPPTALRGGGSFDGSTDDGEGAAAGAGGGATAGAPAAAAARAAS